ncbi:MAG: two-component regulator propeller domain-containing protein [Dysgonomonas sp.]|nr:two-component regulator propeller domain-containing protein [Dysgonomonas sp.]
MKRLIIIILIILPFCVFANDRYYFSHLSSEDGLSQITVTSIYQDSKGFMWFGTRNGLNRYDGYNFDVYVNEQENGKSISDNHILCITEDTAGYLWIGTNNGLNRFDPETNSFERYLYEADNSTSLSNNMVLSLFHDTSGNLWIGTSNGLNLYDRENNSFRRIAVGNHKITGINTIIGYNDKLYMGTHSQGVIIYDIKNEEYVFHKDIADEQNNKITLNDVRALYLDNNENLWIGMHHDGLGLLKKGKQQITIYTQKNGLSNDFIRCINQAPDGNILIGTFDGLNVINPQSQRISQYKAYDAQEGSLSHYSIYSIYFDKARTLWVGTYAGGVNFYNTYGHKFRFYDPALELKSILGIIGPMVEYKNSIYIATEGGGLLEMDKQSGKYSQYKLSNESNGAYTQNILKSLFLDGDRLYCGTNLGAIYSFDLRSKRFSLFHDFKMGNTIYQIGRNSEGELFAAGVNNIGLVFFKKDGGIKDKFTVDDKTEFSFYNLRCILEIEKNIYLIGTRNNGLYYYDLNDKKLISYKASIGEKSEKYLPENYISSIFKDSMGQIWIGTFGGGLCLFDIETETFKTYKIQDGLHNDNVCSIVEDANKHLWISTISGISDFDINTGEFRNYSYFSGININEFTPHTGLKLLDNRIFFSGNNGFISFDPHKIYVNPYIPSIVLRNLYIDNVKVTPDENNDILKGALNNQKEITLEYNQSNIAIEYSALNYIFPNRNQYAYKLEGFDDGWNEVGARRMAYYTNVPAGTYRFVVKGSNNDGVWNNDGTSILITILPPFWKTWWAYCIYILTLIGIFILIFRYYNERKRLENNIKLEQARADAQEEFHQARGRLFTNFSHELRTPLTLIMSPLGDLIEKGRDLPQKVQDTHRLMYSNTLRMLRLVNNLMDFQKKESGTMKLRLEEDDFIHFTDEMVSLFKELAVSRNINLSFETSTDSLHYAFDKSMMEKVYFNFLSNAFKNVPDGGSIDVCLRTSNIQYLKTEYPNKTIGFNNNDITYLILEIRDSGVGIPQDQLEDIFTPFYQVAQNKHSSSGTGLGLSLSKSIIEMHDGVVWAESPIEGGAIFRCIFPINKLTTQDIAGDNNKNKDFSLINRIEGIKRESTETNTSEKGKYTVLVVEDNTDLRDYITSYLSPTYNIIVASDGSEAVEKAISHLPDIIISDLMMPKMDGMEMCAIIKKDLRTSHIPVIMLTAKSMPENIKEGYETGADDYITKPFDSSLLVTRVGNIIQARENLKEIYGKKFSLNTLGVESSSSIDEQFMQKLYKIMEDNISNTEFNLDSFSKDIGMSRASLYRKIKSVTNLSPNEFIRNFRLEMASKLLRETKLPVSEVYVSVGFNSIAYFSTCFKTRYGVSPTEYANQSPKE